MSADNWAICPRCASKHEEHVKVLIAALDEAYGKVPVEEFDRLRSECDAEARKELEQTFREDYEIWGAEDGELNVSYSGGCRECGLGHKFKHSETFHVPAAEGGA